MPLDPWINTDGDFEHLSSDMAQYMPDSFDTFAPASTFSGPFLVQGFENKNFGNEQLSLAVNPYNSTVYEDSYSDSLSSFEPNHKVGMDIPESPSIEKGHKLLQFSSPPSLACHMLDFAARPALLSLSAQLHGMFFLAESAFPGSQESASSSAKDLTCYRRNLFQVTGELNISKGIRFAVREGKQVPITALEATISASETVDHNAVKLICVPWKSSTGGASQAEEKIEKEPEAIPIDLAAGQEDLHSGFVHMPVAWKRLQFRIATANNGRRKELQQHFVLHIKLMATLADGSRVEIAEINSSSIVVRGRSPRNFQARNDLPISGSVGRRSLHISRHSTGDARLPSSRHSKPSKLDLPRSSMGAFQFSMSGENLTPSPGFSDWKMPLMKTNTDLDAVAAQYTDYPVINVATPPEDLFTIASAQASPPLNDLDLMVTAPIMRPASAPLNHSLSPNSAMNSPQVNTVMPRSIPSRLSRSPFEEDSSAGMSPKKRPRTGETPPPSTMTSAPNSIVAPHALSVSAGQLPFMLEGYVDPFAQQPFGFGSEWNSPMDGVYFQNQHIPPVTHVNPEFISVTARGPSSSGKRSFSDD